MAEVFQIYHYIAIALFAWSIIGFRVSFVFILNKYLVPGSDFSYFSLLSEYELYFGQTILSRIS